MKRNHSTHLTVRSAALALSDRQHSGWMARCSALLALLASVASGNIGCVQADTMVDEEDVTDTVLSFDDFVDGLDKDPATGAYLVEEDIRLYTIAQLREYYEQIEQPGALSVYQSAGKDVKWSATEKLQITYCVSSSSFGANYNAAVSAVLDAAGAWEGAAYVDFVHKSDQDSNCTNANNNVVFNVRAVSGTNYNAAAFFPNYSRAQRELTIDWNNATNAAPKTLTGILRHELGHALGFRHEHTRVRGSNCYEDAQFRGLTAYDPGSVMHYRQCPGSSWNYGDYVLTANDTTGVVDLYGSRLAAYGGSGGGAFVDSCPQGSVAVGFDVRTGDWVDQVRLICREISQTGALGATSYTPVRGGNGGTAASGQCPAGQVLRGELVGTNGVWAGKIGGRCDTPEHIFSEAGGYMGTVGPFGANGTLSENACPAGTAITGIYGRSGSWVDRVGLVCSRLMPKAALPVSAPDGLPITISGARINGGGNSAGHILPGAQFTLATDFAISDPGCPGCIDQIIVGLAPVESSSAGSGQGCVYNGVPGTNGVSGTGTVTMTAPTTPGQYFVRFSHGQDYSCNLGWWGAPTAAKNIGIINVY